MKAKKWAIGILVLIGLLAGSLAMGAATAGRPGKAAAAPAAQAADPCVENDDGAEAAETDDQDSAEIECGPQDENEAGETGAANEAEDGHEDQAADTSDEVAPAGTAITAEQAQAIVEQANPGATTMAVEFDRENGVELFEVELDNGQDVKVDAGSGQIIGVETRDEN